MNSLKVHQKKLNAMLGFIQADLEGLSGEERALLALRLKEWSGLDLLMDYIQAIGTHLDKEKGRIVVVDAAEALRHEVFKNIQKKMAVSFNGLIATGIMRIPTVTETLITLAGRFSIKNDFLISPAVLKKIASGKASIEFELIDSSEDIPAFSERVLKATLKELAQTLEGIPKDAILRCKECQKYFVHISRKKKFFCSPRCAYKFIGKERREALKKKPRKYEAFKKKQREKMRKRYEQKQRAKGYKKINHYRRKED